MLNLFAMAEANASRWESRFRELAGVNGRLAEFAQWVDETSRISVNCGWSTMSRLVRGESLKNHHELAREKAKREGGNPEDHLRARLKRFYERRVTFDRAFENGESFRYGALNGGCVGLENYGPLCLVLTVAKQESLAASACLLPGDSLFLCTSAAGELDEGRARELAGSLPVRGVYASVHRVEAVAPGDRTGWARVLLNADDREKRCFEVVFVGTVASRDLAAVRLSRAAHEAAWKAVYAAHAQEARISSKATVADLTALLTAVRNDEFQMEIIP